MFSDPTSPLFRALNEGGRILILDGAMGTMIQRHALGEDDFRGTRFKDTPGRLQGNNELLSLTRPDIIHSIHRAYLEAGADIIEANTFSAQRVSQHEYHTEGAVEEINRASARLAREEADRMTRLTPERPRFVAASIGPTSKTLSLSPDVENPALRSITFDELCSAYTEQMRVLAAEGVDAFLVETIFDTLNAKAALAAAHAVCAEAGRNIPVMLSASIADASGRTLSGQTLAAFVTSVAHDSLVLSVGLNCSSGAADMRPFLHDMANGAPFFVSAHPNAGLPDEEGRYTETPETMAAALAAFAEDGTINIVGGCCGSTPAHIKAIAETMEGRVPRPLPDSDTPQPWLAGLDAFTLLPGTFVNVGERCNVAGSRKFLRLIKEKQYEEALSIARKQVRDGAMALDVNMDDGLLDAGAEMCQFLNLMASDPEVARLPWMIDSSRFEVIEAALKCVQGKAIVNSISLKEGEEKFLARARAIHRSGAAMVVMAFDEEGQATSYQRKVDVCARAYRLLTQEAGVPPTDIIFDPNVLTIATGMKEHDRYALDFIEATGWIRRNLPGAHVSGGVSNLSFAFRGNNYLREAMHAVFLYHAIAQGMDMGIVNPATRVMYGDIPSDLLERLEDAILCRREDAAERLTDFAQSLAAPAPATGGVQEKADRSATPLEQRIAEALRAGDDEFLEADLTEAVAAYDSPAAIIEGPLMKGMQTVGNLFGEGKMFLPQVVKSARTMKKAVAFLQPYIEAGRQEGAAGNGRYLIATVKGDVHDIGKNIVAVVLGCNNFEVTDLGVMVSAETIVKTALDLKPDFIALSGLITPSLDEMCHTAEALSRAGITTPLFVGGATTSELHTALKIAPLYGGPVFHVRDAAQNPVLATKLLGEQREETIARNRDLQQALREKHDREKHGGAAQTASAADGLVTDWANYAPPAPSYIGTRTFRDISIKDVRQLVCWPYFYHFWRVRHGSPEAVQVREEAERLIDNIESRFSLQGQVAFYPAHSTGHSVVADLGAGATAEIATPRQKKSEDGGKERLSLCDYIAPGGVEDWLGAFAVTLSPDFAAEVERLKQADESYDALLLHSVADRLVEAAGEWLHRLTRRSLWGYAPQESLSPDELQRCAYRGIRPAVGYPALPEQAQIFNVARLLRLGDLGIRLTENGAMYPQSSVCGLYFSHPASRYFSV